MIDKKETKKFWDNVAKQTTLSERTSVGMLTEGNEFNSIYRIREEEAHLLKFLALNKSMKVLEVGSGGGRWTFFLANRVSLVVGLDFSGAMIGLSEKLRVERNVENVHFIQTDLLNYDAREKYDVIYFSGVLQYIDDNEIRSSLTKAKEMLAEDGVIISRDTVQEKKRVQLDGDYPVIYRTVAEYATLFSAEGFDMTYKALSYAPRRFSHFTSNHIYNLPFVSFRGAFAIQNMMLWTNKLLGNPRWLMKKHYREMLDTVGEREHRFFKYELE